MEYKAQYQESVSYTHLGKSRAAGHGNKGCCCLPGGLYRCTKTGGAQLFAADAGHRAYGGRCV